VDIDARKVVELLPDAVEVISKASSREKRPVKLKAVPDAGRKQEKVPRCDKPGKHTEKPQPQTAGQINRNFIK
jgi:hypothetical protein